MSELRPTALEAAPLLHALCARAAEESGVRVLAIKGPIVAMQGLRAPRSSADIDLLVHPEDLERYADRLRDAGWFDAVPMSAPRLAPLHAMNLLHAHWPLGIDLHHYFLGFLAPAGDVFDALWTRHRSYVLAGIPVPSLDPVGQTALVALNLLRDDPDGEGPRFRDLTDRAANILDKHERRELGRLAELTDSALPLRPLFARLGLTEENSNHPANPEAWQVWERRVRSVPQEAWAEHIKSIAWWRWPQLAWRTVFLPEDEMRAHHADRKIDVPLWRLRVRRVRSVVYKLPTVLRQLLQK